MGIAETVRVVFQADVSDLKRGLDRVKSSLGDLARGDLSGFAEGLSMSAGAAGLAAGAFVGLGAAAVALGKKTMDFTLTVSDLATSIGSTTEEASALMEIADDMRVPVTALEMAFKTMAKQGVEPSLAGLADMADKFKAIQDPTEKVTFLTKNFGRSGLDIARVLDMDSDKLRNYLSIMGGGQIVTAQEAQQSEDLHMALEELKDSWESMTLTVGAKVIPVLTDLLNIVNESIAGDQQAAATMDAFTLAMRNSYDAVESVYGGLVRLKDGTVLTRAEFVNWSKDNNTVQTSLRGVNDEIKKIPPTIPTALNLVLKINGQITNPDTWWEFMGAIGGTSGERNRNIIKNITGSVLPGAKPNTVTGHTWYEHGAASGGSLSGAALSGLTMVGENGPELVTPGGWVMPSQRTEQALAIHSAVAQMSEIRDDIRWMIRNLPAAIKDSVVAER